jgi:hypothetical protein
VGVSKTRIFIDSLRLKGFRYEDRLEVAEGLKNELARVLSNSGVANRISLPRRVSVLRLGRMQMEAGVGARQVGKRLGGVIGTGIGK